MSVPRRDDRGGVAAQVAVIPAAVLLFFFVVQVSLWFYGREVATAAAQHGLDAARVFEGSEAAGETTANQFLGQVGGLQDYSVSVDRGAEVVTITIEAHPVSVMPFVAREATITMDAAVERVVE